MTQPPAVQLPMFPVAALAEVPLTQANQLVTAWGHKLGACNRPFGSQSWVLFIDEQPVSVAISASIVSDQAAGYPCGQLVELARLCSAEPWANRVALRLWRQVCAPRWPYWPALAAVSYSQNWRHDGDLYRFDGWRKVTEDAGADCGPGATWSKKRSPDDPRRGKKTLWLWEYSHSGSEGGSDGETSSGQRPGPAGPRRVRSGQERAGDEEPRLGGLGAEEGRGTAEGQREVNRPPGRREGAGPGPAGPAGRRPGGRTLLGAADMPRTWQALDGEDDDQDGPDLGEPGEGPDEDPPAAG